MHGVWAIAGEVYIKNAVLLHIFVTQASQGLTFFFFLFLFKLRKPFPSKQIIKQILKKEAAQIKDSVLKCSVNFISNLDSSCISYNHCVKYYSWPKCFLLPFWSSSSGSANMNLSYLIYQRLRSDLWNISELVGHVTLWAVIPTVHYK